MKVLIVGAGIAGPTLAYWHNQYARVGPAMPAPTIRTFMKRPPP